MFELESSDETAGRIFEAYTPYDLEAKVTKAIESMEWLSDPDDGAIELAKQYSRRIDKALEAADRDPDNSNLAVAATKALYLGSHLLNTLKELGGTPGSRLLLEQQRVALVDPKLTKEEDQIASFLSDNMVKVAARARTRT